MKDLTRKSFIKTSTIAMGGAATALISATSASAAPNSNNGKGNGNKKNNNSTSTSTSVPILHEIGSIKNEHVTGLFHNIEHTNDGKIALGYATLGCYNS